MERDDLPAERDEAFLERVADTLAGLPGVQAVALGGSRARETHRPDSDWDFAIYYRGSFDPQHLRDVGWPGAGSGSQTRSGWSSGLVCGRSTISWPG